MSNRFCNKATESKCIRNFTLFTIIPFNTGIQNKHDFFVAISLGGFLG